MSLTIRGSDNILHVLQQYKAKSDEQRGGTGSLATQGHNHPPTMRGHLYKQGRKGPRYFEVAESTPLVLYWRSRKLAKAGFPPNSAIDLTKATHIAHFEEDKTQFFIESVAVLDPPDADGSKEHAPAKFDYVTLRAETMEDAKLWVDVLTQRRNFFQHTILLLRGNSKSSHARTTQDIANSGKRLLKMTSVAVVPNDVGAQNEQENHYYYSASSDEEGDNNNNEHSKYRDELLIAATKFGSFSSISKFGLTASLLMTAEEAEKDFELRVGELGAFPHAFPRKMWEDGSFDGVQLRGQNYLTDGIKVPVTRRLMRLVAVDCFYGGKQRIDHWATMENTRFSHAKKNHRAPPFTWILVYQPGGGISLILYMVPASAKIAKLFVGDLREAHAVAEELRLCPGYVTMLRNYFAGENDEFRNQRFKMVPQMREAPWIVRKSIPQKPALIGTKLRTRYFRGGDYLEQDLDIASTSFIEGLTKLSIGFAKMLVCNMAYTLEGRTSEELPEELLTCGCVVYPDLSKAEHLPGY